MKSRFKDFKETERKKIKLEISAAISFAKEAPFPEEQALSTDVYATKKR